MITQKVFFLNFENDAIGLAVKCYSASGLIPLVSIQSVIFTVIVITKSASVNHGLVR
jgi:hypothetical protein